MSKYRVLRVWRGGPSVGTIVDNLDGVEAAHWLALGCIERHRDTTPDDRAVGFMSEQARCARLERIVLELRDDVDALRDRLASLEGTGR